MKVRIHRGTKEIGGTCVEIESQGKRLVLDVGLPLDGADSETFPLHPVKGFEKADPDLLGVVISHSHQDHYGLAHRLPKETPFLIGKAAQNILAAAKVFSPTGLHLENVLNLNDRKPITLGAFRITPFLVDHSAYDAYAILVEAVGADLFYTGDLRAHGRKGSLFQRLLRHPPEHVDVLLLEGTTLGRSDTEQGFPTEADLENRFVELFKQTPERGKGNAERGTLLLLRGKKQQCPPFSFAARSSILPLSHSAARSSSVPLSHFPLSHSAMQLRHSQAHPHLLRLL